MHYPGLPSHPQHALAERQMRGFGGMISFDVGSLEAARTVLDGVRLFALAESLGGVESLISHPATMTHASVPAERGRHSASPTGWSGSRRASRTSRICGPTSSRRSTGWDDATLQAHHYEVDSKSHPP